MTEEKREMFLNKGFYEDCPGCKVDQRKQLQHSFPIRHLVSTWTIVLCATLPASTLFPFLYFMVRDFHIAKTEKDIGYYAGFVGASYMLGRALTSVIWGMVADRYGRRPVLIMGIISVVIFNTLFGLSTNFWMAISMRFLLGLSNGIVGPIKAYTTEIFKEEHQALGLSVVSAAWGLGLIIGPALGGFLAQPAEKYPNIFPKESLFGRFPYFLPCFCISLFASVVAVATCCWLPETLHNHNEKRKSFETLESEDSQESEGKTPTSKENIMRNWPLMSSILVYCVFSLHDMAYAEIFSLWAVSPAKYEGLGYSTQKAGEILAISGFGLLVFQLTMWKGLLGLQRYVALQEQVLSILVLACYPYIATFSGLSKYLLVNCASVLKNVSGMTIITGLFLLQNRAVEQRQRGAANGISITVMSLFKTMGPAGGGALFSWAQKHQDGAFLPGVQMVFFILSLIEALGVIMTFKPFLAHRSLH